MSSETISAVRQFPDPPAEEAFHGLAGDVVRTIARTRVDRGRRNSWKAEEPTNPLGFG